MPRRNPGEVWSNLIWIPLAIQEEEAERGQTCGAFLVVARYELTQGGVVHTKSCSNSDRCRECIYIRCECYRQCGYTHRARV